MFIAFHILTDTNRSILIVNAATSLDFILHCIYASSQFSFIVFISYTAKLSVVLIATSLPSTNIFTLSLLAKNIVFQLA
jgi:hypothetical protein